jgi:tetratricopeptide (TPR) repeat protein
MIDLAPSRPAPRHKLIKLYRKMNREEPMIDQLRRLVEIHVNAGEYDDAINCLRDLMAIRPEDTRARVRYIDLYTQLGDECDLLEDYLQLARILSRKGSTVEATRLYEKILVMHPEDPVARGEFIQFLFEEGQVHRGVDETRELSRLIADRDPQQAGRLLERALNYAPDELEMRLMLAGIYLKTNRRGMALDNYRSLARQFEQTGNRDRLIEVIESIVRIDTLNVEYRQRLAELYYAARRLDDACDQSVQLAGQYLERELNDLAEHELRRVLEHRPNDAAVLQKLVDAHLKGGEPGEILPDLLLLAELYKCDGRLKEAVRVYRLALAADANNVDALQDYINVYIQIGLEQDLIDDYLKLADLRARRGEIKESLRLYKHLMNLAPDHPEVRERLTETQQMLRHSGRESAEPTPDPVAGDRPFAPNDPLPPESDPAATRKLIRNYENVLKLNAKNPTANAKLAELLERIGDQEQADAHWRHAAAQFLEKGEIERCIEIGEKLERRHPEDSRIREILSSARVHRDSLRAIDGALFDKL